MCLLFNNLSMLCSCTSQWLPDFANYMTLICQNYYWYTHWMHASVLRVYHVVMSCINYVNSPIPLTCSLGHVKLLKKLVRPVLVENVFLVIRPRKLFRRLPVLAIIVIIWYCACSVQLPRLMSASCLWFVQEMFKLYRICWGKIME